MTSLFGKPTQRAEPTPPTLANPAIDAMRKSQLSNVSDVYGRAQTILTSGQGAADAGTAQRRTILGS